MILTEDEVHNALEYLRKSSGEIGPARARAVKAGHWIKHVEALEYKASSASNESGRKADARTSQRYIDAINEDAVATGEIAKLYAAREAASAIIEAWRTASATLRQATKL